MPKLLKFMDKRKDGNKYDFVWTWNLGESDKDYERWLMNYVLRHYVGLDNDVIRELKKRG